MLRRQVCLTFAIAAIVSAADFSGQRAYDDTAKLVAFGPRPSGSDAIAGARNFILERLKGSGAQLLQDPFTADTPSGQVRMVNLIARFPGSSGRAVVFTGHYDTKRMPGFVGANDGGSSAGLLLELANALAHQRRRDDVYLVWLDGEEAVVQWTDEDSLYGSRHLASKWRSDATLSKIHALINVDMIGDRDLHIAQETNSSSNLTRLVWEAADSLGYSAEFPRTQQSIEDDHLPFLALGVNALDLIDFDYGPGHAWWHTKEDTMDKLSPRSLEVVGKVLLESLRRLEQ